MAANSRAEKLDRTLVVQSTLTVAIVAAPSANGIGVSRIDQRGPIGVYYLDPADGATKACPANNADDGVFSDYSGGADGWNGRWTETGVLSVGDLAITGYRTYAIDAFVYTEANARTTAVVPEPSTPALLGLSLAGLAASHRRKQSATSS